MKHILSNMY